MSTQLPPDHCRGEVAKETKGVGGVGVILLMEEIYLQGFYTSQVVANGISSIHSI